MDRLGQKLKTKKGEMSGVWERTERQRKGKNGNTVMQMDENEWR